MSPRRIAPLLVVMTLLTAGGALAQDKGSVNPKPLPPLANPNDPTIGAKELFARKLLPSKGPAHVIGSYTRGCIGGAMQQDDYLGAIEAAGLRIEAVQPNPEYAFISDSAQGATGTFGVKSISILATKLA